MKLVFKLLLITSIIVSCKSVSILSNDEISSKTNKSIAEIMDLDKEYGASILHDSQVRKVDLPGDEIFTTFTQETYILYINDKGEKYTNSSFSLRTDDYDLNSITIFTIKQDGTTIEQKVENMKRSSVVNNRGDEILKVEFNFPNVEPGDILYKKVVTSTKKQYVYNLIWDIDYNIPVRHTEFTMVLPRFLSNRNAKNRYNLFTQNIVIPKPNVETAIATGENYFTYNLNDIMPIKDKPYSLPSNVTKREILFYYVNESDKDWQTSLFNNKTSNSSINYTNLLEPNSSIEDFINKNINKNGKSELQLMNDVKDLLFKNYKIDFDKHVFSEGKVKPIGADISFGKTGEKLNLKDLNVLFISMLRSLGFDAYLTYNKPYNQGELLKIKVEIFDLSSCLTLVKGKTNSYWIDLSREYLKAGEIYQTNQKTEGFLINDKTSKADPIRVGFTDYKSNKAQTSFTGEMAEDLTIKGTFSLKLYGNSSHYLRYKKHDLTELEFDKYLKDLISENIDFTEVNNIIVSDFDATNNSLELTAELILKDKAKKLGNNIVLPSYLFKKSKFLGALNDESRSEDFYFGYSDTEVEKISIKLPKKYKINGDRLKLTNNNSYINYDYSTIINTNDNSFNLFKLTQFKTEIIPAKNMHYLVDVKKSLETLEKHSLRLEL